MNTYIKTKLAKKCIRSGMACIVAILLCFSLAACTNATSAPNTGNNNATNEAGFASSQDAAKAYLEGLRDQDLSRMINAFGIETYTKAYDFEKTLTRYKVYSPALEIKLPNANDFVTDMNIESRRSSVNKMIMRQYIFLTNPSLDQTTPLPLEDEAETKEFVSNLENSLNAPALSTLTIVGFIPPEKLSEIYSSEKYKENLARSAKALGANALESNIVVFNLDGKEYLLCYDAVQYGEKWFIEHLGGNIGVLLNISNQTNGLVSGELIEDTSYREFIIPA